MDQIPARRNILRETFDPVAELYDRIRPGYPQELLSDLSELAGTGTGCRVLEIGCGTGQLTLPLAEQGCEIVAIDIGREMVAVAARKLSRYPAVQVIQATFEDWTLPVQPFAVVVSATAFHWLDPAVRVPKCADALRSGGVLAVIRTYHIAGGDDSFFMDVQACYERWSHSEGRPFRLPAAHDIPLDSEELERSARFGEAIFRRYEWEETYSAHAYCELLQTYSDHSALHPEARQGLLDCIANIIDSRYGGKIVKRYLTELCLGKRLTKV